MTRHVCYVATTVSIRTLPSLIILDMNDSCCRKKTLRLSAVTENVPYQAKVGMRTTFIPYLTDAASSCDLICDLICEIVVWSLRSLPPHPYPRPPRRCPMTYAIA